jgi:hypothetical protein
MADLFQVGAARSTNPVEEFCLGGKLDRALVQERLDFHVELMAGCGERDGSIRTQKSEETYVFSQLTRELE